MLKIPYWLNIHKLLVKYKKIIFNLFLASYFLSAFLVLLGFYLFNNNTLLYGLLFEVSSSFGSLALVLFLATLAPGIFSRFKVFPLLSASIILFRRQLGILMFLVVIIHSFYLSTIPAIMTSSLSLSFLSTRELIGTIALIILLPVWLTSNNFSQKSLGKFWKTIQRLTYFSLIAIFVHVATISLGSGLLALAVLSLELTSWLKVWFFDKKNQQ